MGGRAVICPRCGKVVKSVYQFRSNGRVYYRFYHGDGSRCYVGPAEYVYATRTQWRTLTIYGAVVPSREELYVEGAIEALREMRGGSES
ncbi:hypothetical protein JCM16161A_23200 [Vulcanisaeta sp. JCM 16161]|uniref:hypothetical protein n=1 Tax=Vulcanisaeta sp. JCM 16161 TaxID=1295372 RepID=UPI00406D0AAA